MTLREIPAMCRRCSYKDGAVAVAKMRADDSEILILREEVASARCEIERLRLELTTRCGVTEGEVIYGVEC
jgi:hypothetical protein